jgi:hypothetical protein
MAVQDRLLYPLGLSIVYKWDGSEYIARHPSSDQASRKTSE